MNDKKDTYWTSPEFLQVFCVLGNFYANHIESSSVVRKAKFLKRTKHFKVIRDFDFLERKTAAKIFHFLHKTILSNKKTSKNEIYYSVSSFVCCFFNIIHNFHSPLNLQKYPQK